jgi:predicted nucleic acid-binding protein
VRNVIDSSLWIDYFRKRTLPSIKAQVDQIVQGTDIAICEPIQFELTRAVPRKEAQRIREFFATVPILQTPRNLWEESSQLGQKCVEAGFQPPALDLLIAHVCISHDALITTFDAHFEKIASVAPLRINLMVRSQR